MKILVFDNYDSFTYNIVHCIEQITGRVPDVYRNDKISLDAIAVYDKIVLSPGPGLPSESGILLELIKEYAGKKSIFGVCLGLQAMAESFGGTLQQLDKVFHGVDSAIHVMDKNEPLFQGMPEVFRAGRYHSWVADSATLPSCFKVTARDPQGLIMAIRHNDFDLQAVQFHPESILSPYGKQIIENWLFAPKQS